MAVPMPTTLAAQVNKSGTSDLRCMNFSKTVDFQFKMNTKGLYSSLLYTPADSRGISIIHGLNPIGNQPLKAFLI
jgi:hypothetical protein